MLLASQTFDTVLKRFRSFNAKNLGSAGQRAAKYRPSNFENDLTPVQLKLGLRGSTRAEDFFSRPPDLTVVNFKAV